MKIKFINYVKELLALTTNNKKLFECRKKSFWLIFIIGILTISMMSIPTYIKAKNKPEEEIVKNFPQIYEPMKELFSSSLDCKIINGTLTCEENANKINMVVGENIKYTIIANENIISNSIDVVYGNPKDTDNLILLLENNIKIRYSEHDYINKTVNVYELLGTYSELEGFNFKETSTTLTTNPECAESLINNFIYNVYLSNLTEKTLISSLANSIVYFLSFVLVSSLIIKFPTLLKKRKGFKFSECIKISVVASLPALIISTASHFIIKTDFLFVFIIIYMIRILYIYFKYIGTKNNIYKELFLSTKEERFKI